MSSVFSKSNIYVHIHQKGRKDTYQWLKSGYLQKVVLHVFLFSSLCFSVYPIFFLWEWTITFVIKKKEFFLPIYQTKVPAEPSNY